MRPVLLSFAALCVAALSVPVAQANDEAFEIKTTRFTPKGKPLKVNDKTVITQLVKVSDENGNLVQNKKVEKTQLRAYVEKTLEVNTQGKRTKFSRAYGKAKDVDGDESEDKPYHDRTILFERPDDKWNARTEDKPDLARDDLKELVDQLDKSAERSDKVLYPKKAVKVGEKWKLDGKEIAAFFEELKIEAKTFKGEGKLVKAYKKGKQRWGTVELTMAFDAPLGEAKGGKGEMKATIDQPIDGSSAAAKGGFTLKLSVKQQVEQGDKKFDVDVTVSVVLSSDHADAE